MPSGIPSSISAEGICNLALGHLKVLVQIQDLQTDKSAAGSACRAFYDICRKMVNSDFKWPFATTQAALALVQSAPFPYDTYGSTEWAFAYQYPADCMTFTRVISGIRNDSRSSRIPYRIMSGASGKIILTDMENAHGEYVLEMTQEDSFAANYCMAVSLKLAVYIAPMITGGDPFKLGERAARLYDEEVSKAQANAVNEEQVEQEQESEFILARGSTSTGGRGCR